jgi:hypothetical protein
LRVQLFGIGQKGVSPVINAQERINCYAEIQTENDRTNMALVGMPGKTLLVDLGASTSRGIWSVDTLPVPVYFTVHQGTLYSVNNAGTASVIGTIGTTSGDISMADDGTFLVLVDGLNGYVYNMRTFGALTKITDGNFTTSPKYVTWQDNYFIVTSGSTNQWQLSQISPSVDPTVWPADQINFTGSAPGALQAGMADHSILNLFGNVYTEFWQDTGAADFPYAAIPGSAQEFGLASAWSLFKYDNSLAGLFRNKMGEVNMSRMSGFRLDRISNFELEGIINDYSSVSDCRAFGYMFGGHPMAQFSFPTANRSWLYDGSQRLWSQLKDAAGNRDWGEKFCNFLNQKVITDYRSGRIYKIDDTVYSNNGEAFPMEVTSKHIWNDDKYLGIQQLQVDVESGVGLATGQGSNPQMMLLVSKDGGRTFVEVAWSSIGKVGAYTQRVIWRSLGAAQDWVLRLRVTDPVKRVLTGCSAEIVGGTF